MLQGDTTPARAPNHQHVRRRGASDSVAVGRADGLALGSNDGDADGNSVGGPPVGAGAGTSGRVGFDAGLEVGGGADGDSVGAIWLVGDAVGAGSGDVVGSGSGTADGAAVGTAVLTVGSAVGVTVGDASENGDWERSPWIDSNGYAR